MRKASGWPCDLLSPFRQHRQSHCGSNSPCNAGSTSAPQWWATHQEMRRPQTRGCWCKEIKLSWGSFSRAKIVVYCLLQWNITVERVRKKLHWFIRCKEAETVSTFFKFSGRDGLPWLKQRPLVKKSRKVIDHTLRSLCIHLSKQHVAMSGKNWKCILIGDKLLLSMHASHDFLLGTRTCEYYVQLIALAIVLDTGQGLFLAPTPTWTA